MYCTKCGKQINDDSKFCDGCGNPVAQTVVEPNAVEIKTESAHEETQGQLTEHTEPAVNNEPPFFAVTAEEPVLVTQEDASANHAETQSLSAESSGAQSTAVVLSPEVLKLKQKVEETGKKAFAVFKSLSPKKRKILILVPIIILMVVIIVSFGEGIIAGGTVSEDNAIQLAKYEVSQRIFSKGEPLLTNVKVVDKDGRNRFIVTMTQDGTFDNYWAVWIEFDKSGDYYHNYCDYHGDYNSKYGTLTQEGLVELFRTNPDFRWGEDIWIKED